MMDEWEEKTHELLFADGKKKFKKTAIACILGSVAAIIVAIVIQMILENL